MNKKLFLPVMVVLAVLFTACSKPLNVGPEYFSASPNPLESVGGQVKTTITMKVPEKIFEKNSELTVTPVLVYNGKELKLTAAKYQGEKVKANNTAVPYKEGGSYTIPVAFAYQPEMAKSELYLECVALHKGKEVAVPRFKVADGILATETLASVFNVTSSQSKDAFQRIVNEQVEASIMFLIQQADVRKTEAQGESVKGLAEALTTTINNDRKNATALEISSYASPDGGVDLNTKLAENREKSTKKFYEESLKKAGVTTQLNSKFTAEDWDGFKDLLAKSSLQDKDAILRILSSYEDPAERETQIKNMASAFETLKTDILPQLRRSKVTGTFELIGKTDEELKAAVASNPSALTLEEILYAATLPGVNAAAAYNAAVKQYPEDYRAYNNLATIALKAGNASEAEAWLNKAAQKNGRAAEVNMNQGLVALNKGDKAAAEAAFGKAAGAQNLNEALGSLYLSKGDYSNAAKQFGSAKTNNAAVAQIMNKDYSAAKNTLSGIATPDAMTYYLMAVVGARTNNESMVIDNLKESVKRDASMGKKAANDIEFAKFAANSSFTAIAK